VIGFLAMMTKPREVGWATGLLWASLAMWLFTRALDWTYLTSRQPTSHILFNDALTLSFTAFLIFEISKGKNWARIVYLVLILLGAVPYFVLLRAAIGRSRVVALLSTLETLMEFVAIAVVFSRPAKEWFEASMRSTV